MKKSNVAIVDMPLKTDRGWFERKVSELIAAVEKLPPDRKRKFARKLDADGSGR